MTVGKLLREIDTRELTEWMAYWTLEPFGEEWKQAAIVARSIAGGKLEDHIPYPKPPQSQAEIEQFAESILGSLPR